MTRRSTSRPRKNPSGPELCPAQQSALTGLQTGLERGTLVALRGAEGRGKSTVLRALHEAHGGRFLEMRDFVERCRKNHPSALEESFYELALTSLRKHPLTIIDDFHLANVSDGGHFYPRGHYFSSVLKALVTYALEAGKKCVLASGRGFPEAVDQRAYAFTIDRLRAADYAHVVRNILGPEVVSGLDFEKVYRFAPKLNCHQLRTACHWLAGLQDFSTDRLIDYLRSQRLASNVDLGEVTDVNLADLKGVEEVLRTLEIHIALPLENDALATKLNLRPKRGVLLYGPPGTGKTTIGRALAHRLRGKFFLIDGTFITGTDDFYCRVQQVFESAKDNAPSVIFIDDADAIFEDGEERGLYRYLLTMLDGLESESAGRVCVMMTAMNIGHLPPALVRSGRVELWLEMKVPDASARAEILRHAMLPLPKSLQLSDLAPLVQESQDFTGADLKRTVADATGLYAYDVARGAQAKDALSYYTSAIAAVRHNREQYATAEAQAALHKFGAPGRFAMGLRPFGTPGNDD